MRNIQVDTGKRRIKCRLMHCGRKPVFNVHVYFEKVELISSDNYFCLETGEIKYLDFQIARFEKSSSYSSSSIIISGWNVDPAVIVPAMDITPCSIVTIQDKSKQLIPFKELVS